MINRVKGTHDFLDLTLFNFIVNEAKKHLALYCFTEVKTPILEPLDLFKRSLGLYTDVVSKEMFLIQGQPDEQICLRPEATASIVRAFIENGVQQTPWKVFTYGPMYRHERPQKGRYREFNQINMEVIGSESIAQDAHLIKMLDRFFHEILNLNNYALLINFLGCFEDRKLYRELLKDFLDSPQAELICDNCRERKERNIMRVFDCKTITCQQIYMNAPLLINNLCKPCTTEWEQLKEQLHLLSVSYVCKPTLVRGLDYYNKTVFEFTSDNLGAQSAFCGGGRYDQLVGQLSGKEDQPSIGAAIGIERVMLLLEPMRDILPLPQQPALHVILPMSKEQVPLALLLADTLQAADIYTDVLMEDESIKNKMRKANKLAATYALILGDQEQETKTVTVKNMVTGNEEKIAQIDLVNYLKR
jgi:histidyl-tRNA synthetase